MRSLSFSFVSLYFLLLTASCWGSVPQEDLLKTDYEKACQTLKKGLYKKAYTQFEILHDKGYLPATIRLGVFCLSGKGATPNPEKGIAYLEEAMKKNDPDALVLLGNLYLQGLYGQTINHKKGRDLMEKAAELGHPGALYNMGWLYDQNPTPENMKMAFEYYSKAAKLGFIAAYHNLGICYEKGLGVGVNFKLAFLFYKKAAESDHIPSLVNLSQCYIQGKGTDKNDGLGFALLNEKEKTNDPGVLYHLGVYFLEGTGVKADSKKAITYFWRAAEENHPLAYFIVNLLEKIT
jgi:TPR repeat protein